MALWGAIVAGLLVLGSLPLLVGLAVVMPVLGHATWHLYRAGRGGGISKQGWALPRPARARPWTLS